MHQLRYPNRIDALMSQSIHFKNEAVSYIVRAETTTILFDSTDRMIQFNAIYINKYYFQNDTLAIEK